ncbi:hypothetical protein [Amycolatopsis sp. YIM 10]|uniref:hypothetical protein n=1 Tax=Amycolatopsis sp. YIM 10 TaxID=2653857 RepID=UPI00129036AF|nr:hypothetical protein [Amycolatopsis sp. YIM 10]
MAVVLMWMIAVIGSPKTSSCRYDRLQRALSDGGVRGAEAYVDGGGELLVLHHDQQLGLRGRVQVKSAVRDVGPVGDRTVRGLRS